ncbi:LysM peptidoglycan-binding domain-containing protein [Humibacter ginsenosidimutans]|uniref:LysM peptidoglycan-binding domain-containing protein n=1 Tax=Humibacter ginsenosidimutans TaxID=2599293 RepID=A0A5B8M330_9MICO|nr:LysM domain-containing protein [Humibacter ginsenosidimutans]QDZ14561.1 LysM peptidoglycan-binding domain-containing protein [Humibacter ginsenosidimutans]
MTVGRGGPGRIAAARRGHPVCAAAVAVLLGSAVVLTGCTGTHGRPSVTTHGATSTSAPRASASLGPAADGGARENAIGQATMTAPGHFRYIVAAGDTPFAIAGRFGVCMADLYGSNPGLDGHQSDLYVGQRLTIARVKGPYHDAADCLSGDNESDAYP